jgi:hypothetical protein
MMKSPLPVPRENPTLPTGTGALCAEAQADGVPCTELGRDCEICGKALQRRAYELKERVQDSA